MCACGDRHQTIGDDGGVDLYFDCVLRCAPEFFDEKMLLYPFKKQLDTPPSPIKVGYPLSGKIKVVGQEIKGLVTRRVIICDDPERFLISCLCPSSGKKYPRVPHDSGTWFGKGMLPQAPQSSSCVSFAKRRKPPLH